MDGRKIYLRPSAAALWSACPGYVSARAASVDMSELIGADVTVREEGTAGHWLSELMLTRQPLPKPGEESPNGVVMDDDLWDACDVYVDACLPFAQNPAFDCDIESPIDCSVISEGMTGTGDFVGVNVEARYIAIRDAKFGYRYVPEETPQLEIYGAGVLVELGWDFDESVTIDLGIVQPRCFGTDPHRSRIISGAQLGERVKALQQAAARALDPNSPLIAGNHCVDCPLRWECPALTRLAGDAVTVAAQRRPERLTPAQADVELVRLELYHKLLGERIDGLKQQMHYEIQTNNHCVNNYELVESLGRERFIPDKLATLTKWAREKYQVDTHVSKPITPSQLRKLLPAEARSTVDDYSFRPSNGLELKRITPKRRAALDNLINAGNQHGK